MASRTKILSIQYYDRDGGLDWAIHGTEWHEWYEHQRVSKTKEEVAGEIREKFERMLEVALDMRVKEFGDSEINQYIDMHIDRIAKRIQK